jgi:hypothetical protein
MNGPVRLTSNLSIYPFLIRMVFEETSTELAIGTGFIYEQQEQYYLITNGHCVTGVNPEINKRISRHAGYPTAIKMRVRIIVKPSQVKEASPALIAEMEDDDKVAGAMLPDSLIVGLYKDSDYTQPQWFIHPKFGYNVDVVAIPLIKKSDVPEGYVFEAININSDLTATPVVGDDVYVLGYPFGITDPMELPIWKRGSIASEPQIPFQGLPKMLIDTATRSGMSGAPVILIRHGNREKDGLNPNVRTSSDTAYGFVGVYSGRIGTKEDFDAQLGIVWHKEVIEEIIVGQVSGTIDFQKA